VFVKQKVELLRISFAKILRLYQQIGPTSAPDCSGRPTLFTNPQEEGTSLCAGFAVFVVVEGREGSPKLSLSCTTKRQQEMTGTFTQVGDEFS
jgi:hypothetical protein